VSNKAFHHVDNVTSVRDLAGVRKQLSGSTALATLIAAGLFVFVPVTDALSEDRFWDGGSSSNRNNDVIDGGSGTFDAGPNKYWTNSTGSTNSTFGTGNTAIFGSPDQDNIPSGVVKAHDFYGNPVFGNMEVYTSGYEFRRFGSNPTNLEFASGAEIFVKQGKTVDFSGIDLSAAAGNTGTIEFRGSTAPGAIANSSLGIATINLNSADLAFDNDLKLSGRLRMNVDSNISSEKIFLFNDSQLHIDEVNAFNHRDSAAPFSITTDLTLFSDSSLHLNRNNTLGALRSTSDQRVYLDNARLTIDTGASVQADFKGQLRDTNDGTGSLTKTGAGKQILSGINTFTGRTSVSGGTLTLVGGSALADTGSVNISNATVELGSSDGAIGSDSETIGTLSGTATGILNLRNNNLTINQSADASFSGTINGTGNLVKKGSGNLTLNTVNTAGTLEIDAGTVTGESADTFANIGQITIGGQTMLQSDGSSAPVEASLGLNHDLKTGDSILVKAGGGISVGEGNSVEVSRVISGSDGFAKRGKGALTLSAANTYTGTTTIDAGSLNVTGSIQSNEFIVGTEGTFSVASGASVQKITSSGTTSNAGTLNSLIVKDGEFSLSGTVTTTADIEGGKLKVTGPSNVGGLLHQSGGTIEGANPLIVQSFKQTGGTFEAGGQILAGTQFDLQAGTIKGKLSGVASLKKTTEGITILNSSNNFSGTSTLEGGVVKLEAVSALSSTSVNLNGGSIELADGITLANALTFSQNAAIKVAEGSTAGTTSASITGSGTLEKTGKGTLALQVPSTRTNDTHLKEGTLRLGSHNALGSGKLTADASTVIDLAFASGLTTTNDITLNGNAEVSKTSGLASLSGVISGTGNLKKRGDGTLFLRAHNTYTGETIVERGSLNVTGSLASKTVRLTGSNTRFDVGGETLADDAEVVLSTGSQLNVATMPGAANAETIGAVSGNGNFFFSDDSRLTTGNSQDQTLSGNFSGSGVLKKQGSGNLTLSGSNGGFSGTFEVAGGKLTLDGSNSVGANTRIETTGSTVAYTDGTTITAPLVINSDTTKLEVATSATATQAGVISELGGARPLEKIGNGTLRLSGQNTFSGPTKVTAGKLVLAGGNAIGDSSTLTSDDGTTIELEASEKIGAVNLEGALFMGTQNLTIGQLGSPSTIAGYTTGSGKIEKIGAGRLDMRRSVGFSGDADVSGGTLAITSGTFRSGFVNASNNSVIELDGTNQVMFAGTKFAMGSFRVLRLAGQTAIDLKDSSELQINGPTALARLNGTANTSVLLSKDSSLQWGFTEIGATATDTFSGVISGEGSLQKSGTSDLVLNGANSFTGNFAVSGGTVTLNGSVASKSVNISGSGKIKATGSSLADDAIIGFGGGDLSSKDFNFRVAEVAVGNVSTPTLELANDETVGAIAGVGKVDIGSHTLTLAGSDNTIFQGEITGTGGIVKTGTATFALFGQPNHEGSTDVRNGLLGITGGSSLSDTANLNIEKDAVVGFIALGGAEPTTEKIGGLTGSGTFTFVSAQELEAYAKANNLEFYSGVQQDTVNSGAVRVTVATVETVEKPAENEVEKDEPIGRPSLEISSNEQASTFDGKITGDGDLIKSGTATFMLTGDNDFTGTTAVKGGRLSILGRLAGASTVSFGATLDNRGTVGNVAIDAGGLLIQAGGATAGNVTNAGSILATGTSTFGAFNNNGAMFLSGNGRTGDVLKTTGDLTLGSNSILGLDVAADKTSDRIDVAGAVSLGGRLDVNGIGDVNGFKDATSGRIKGQTFIDYTIITNDGKDATSGQFSEIRNNLAFLTASVTSTAGDGNDVVLTLTNPNPIPDFEPFSDNDNEMGAASALAAFDYSGEDGQELLSAVLGLTNDQARSVLDQITGDGIGNVAATGGALARGFTGVGLSRAGNFGSGFSSSGGASNQAAYAPTTSTEADPFASIGLSTNEGTSAQSGYKLWTEIVGSYSVIKQTAISPRISALSGGVFVGGEFMYVEGALPGVIGASVGYSKTDFATSTAGFDASSDNFHVGLYGGVGAAVTGDTGFSLTGATSATFHNYKTTRNINVGALTRTAAGNFSGTTFDAQIRASYASDLNLGSVVATWAPVVGLDISRGGNRAFTETGAGALNITAGATKTSSLRSVVGFQVGSEMDLAGTPVTTEFSALWNHEFGSTSQLTTLSLAGSPTQFTTRTSPLARDSFTVAGQASFELAPQMELQFSGKGDFSRTNMSAEAGVKLEMGF
jgi:autotransporter-associated beta strand protein